MENFKFKHVYDNEVVDVIPYCLDYIQKYPGLEIYVGTDSQNKKKISLYCTVIAFRAPGSVGVHFIYCKDIVKKIKDKWTRLWKEAEHTAIVANYLRQNLVPVHHVEVDYNIDKASGSYMMVNAGVGYLKGLGYENVIAKPAEQVAVKAANHLVQ